MRSSSSSSSIGSDVIKTHQSKWRSLHDFLRWLRVVSLCEEYVESTKERKEV